jgi:hypothetical protein
MNAFCQFSDNIANFLLRSVHAIRTILSSTEFISALSGAFFGVAGASLLESRRRHREKREREYEAVLRTQAVIISQANSLGWIAKDYPSGDSFDNLKTVVLGLTRQMLDFKDLAFVGKSSDPQLLIELDVSNESYDFFRRLLEARNAAIEEFLRHPETEIKQFDSKTGQIAAVGPERLLFKIRQTNSAVSRSLANAKRVNDATMQRLLTFARSEFPGRQVLHARENDPSTVAP